MFYSKCLFLHVFNLNRYCNIWTISRYFSHTLSPAVYVAMQPVYQFLQLCFDTCSRVPTPEQKETLTQSNLNEVSDSSNHLAL